MTMQQYGAEAEYLGATESISTCPHCGRDWYRHEDNEPPMFDSIVTPSDHETTMLTTLVWRIKCFWCDGGWVQVMQLSPLFNNELT